MAYSVLVVDSDEAFSTILKEGLEATGEYQVILAHAGDDALESVVERPFDAGLEYSGYLDQAVFRG